MKMTLTIAVTLLAAGIMLTTSQAGAQTSAASDLKTDQDKISYSIGADIGKNVSQSLKRNDIEVEPSVVLRAFKEALAGEKLLLTDDEMKTILTQLQKDTKTKSEAKAKAMSEANKKAGEEFLAANKSKEGVVTLPDGLQYKVLKQGDGPKPTASDSVECNYRGTLIDGKEFDSSEKHGGKPATFGVKQVIPGWTEILQLMPVGSKYRIFVPAGLAYGSRGAGADIGPDSTLIFDIELLSIKPKTDAAAPSMKAPHGMPPAHAAPAPAPAAAPAPATPAK
jgi:FKBP-type peptidyl-prolyl cis-trans isomerase FklB